MTDSRASEVYGSNESKGNVVAAVDLSPKLGYQKVGLYREQRWNDNTGNLWVYTVWAEAGVGYK